MKRKPEDYPENLRVLVEFLCMTKPNPETGLIREIPYSTFGEAVSHRQQMNRFIAACRESVNQERWTPLVARWNELLIRLKKDSTKIEIFERNLLPAFQAYGKIVDELMQGELIDLPKVVIVEKGAPSAAAQSEAQMRKALEEGGYLKKESK